MTQDKKALACTHQPPIAIIGMGCIFPESRNLKEYWQLLLNGKDGIKEIPGDTHWKIEDYFNEDPASPDQVYCRRGGFLPKVGFDPLAYGIPPKNLEATDTSQLLALEVAKMALADAGYPASDPYLQEKKVNVILGVTGTQELVIPLGARLSHPIWKQALIDSGIDPEKQSEVLERIRGDYVQWQENSFPGLLGNVVAGRIANRLNLSGTNTVSDAACASSLSAIHIAIMELASGKCDMSITGGVDTLNDIFMHMCFAKTGVLSHTSDARPFSKDADGTVLGEGIGLIILKRLEDAEKDKDRIYAVIRGMGSSSDGKTSAIYAPEAKGQIKALNQAYAISGIHPSSVGLIEAHGTGTRVGDKVEFSALRQCFEAQTPQNQVVLGSVKSMIGHTKAAAGAAGIIKAALALHNKVLPPTLKAEHPDPELDINHSPFYLNSQSKPWHRKNPETPRRSGVSAFGFGGSNFHAVLEEYHPDKQHVSWDGTVQILAFSAKNNDLLRSQITEFEAPFKNLDDESEIRQWTAHLAMISRNNFSPREMCRLLVVHHTGDDILKDLEQARACIENKPASKNIYYRTGSPEGKLGFLFPGQGSQYVNMGKDLCSIFPEALQVLETAGEIFAAAGEADASPLLQDLIFPVAPHVQPLKASEEKLRTTDVAQPAIGALSLAMTRILERFGVKADIACGHSFGELSALRAAGWISESDFLSLAAARGKFMARASRQDGDPGSMLAVKAPLEEIEAFIAQEAPELVLANKNSLLQGVLSGPTDQIQKARKACRQKGWTAVKLPVAAAFHSKLVESAAQPFQKALKPVKVSSTGVKVISNSLGGTYPDKAAKIKQTLGRQLLNPVNFVDNLETMKAEGVTCLLEVGPKNVLQGLARSVLDTETVSILSLDASSGKGSGVQDLAHTLCSLAAQGFGIDLTPWEDPAECPKSPKMRVYLSGANQKPENPCAIPKSAPGQEAAHSGQQTLPPEPPTVKTPINSPAANQADTQRSHLQPQRTISGASQDNQERELRQPENRGTAMSPATPNFKETPSSTHAMQAIQKGLEAMQALQEQTARAHEKFLETQAMATQALAGMMAQTNGELQPFTFTSAPAQQTVVQQQSTWQQHSPMQEPVPAVPRPSAPVDQNPLPAEIQPPLQQDATSKAQAVPEQISAPEKSGDTVSQESDTEAGNDVQPILFEIVSRLTGFPVEMLELDMDIESDLGIDSIKKVEIISEMEKQIPECGALSTDSIGTVRTLQDICDTVQAEAGRNISPAPAQAAQTVEAPAAPRNEADEAQPVSDADSASKIAMVLMDTISELTGFPVEMLEPEMNLESDLGIDSIKRVEILSKIEQQVEHIETIATDEISGLKTIQEIVDYLDSGTPPGQTEKQSAAEKKTPHSETEPAVEKKNPGNLIRQTVELKKYPTNQIRFYNGARIELPESRSVYITKVRPGNDSASIDKTIQKEFTRIGIKAQLVDIQKEIPDLPDAAGIVVLPDAFSKTSVKTSSDFLVRAFALASKNAAYLMASAKEKGAFFTTLSFLGGGFGFTPEAFQTDPVLGGLAGLTKTAALEWKDVLCHAIDLPDDLSLCMENIEAAVSLMMTHGAVEMGLKNETCCIPGLVSRNLPEAAETGHLSGLTEADVVMVSGGAKGVTAACAVELAKVVQPCLALLGSSPAPGAEPDWATELEDPAQLKKAILTHHKFKKTPPRPTDVEQVYRAILSGREIRSNMAAMASAGAQVRYYPCDITDKKQVSAVAAKVQEELGTVTAIVHGAGILEDKKITDKTRAQCTRVLQTKIRGLENLAGSVETNQLKAMVLFSSVAARGGNQGQCDYAMANEVLNKTAQLYARNLPDCKVLAINWGPWEGGMVTPSLKKEFHRRGIELIPVPSGARQLVRELSQAPDIQPEIVIGATLNPPEQKKAPRLSRALQVDIGPEAAPILNDHRIDNRAVVPFALLMECHAHAAEKNNPGLVFAGMDEMRLLAGIRPEEPSFQADVNLSRCTPDKNRFQTMSTITSGAENQKALIHSSCRMILKEHLPKPPVLSEAAFMDLVPYPESVDQVYADILFHGKGLQAITQINGYSEKGVEVISTPAPAPEKWLASPFLGNWVIDPLMIDAAFQAAVLWCKKRMGQVCLPSYIESLRLYEPFRNHSGDIRILFTVNEESRKKINGYFTFLNADNQVIASIMGFEAITYSGLQEKFKPGPLFSRKQLLAFAEGNPSEAFGKKYQDFDQDRKMARLPRPPYFFLDAILSADHPQWEMSPAGWIEAQYMVPADAWYFRANQAAAMPYAVLLEIALQPCGWLAAYSGAALHSDQRLYFRNLGGKAVLSGQVFASSGTLTMRSRMTGVSKAGDMIIHDFDFEVQSRQGTIFKGHTNFGFFTAASLKNQVGVQNSRLNVAAADMEGLTDLVVFDPGDAPVSPSDPATGKRTGMPSKALRMIDKIHTIIPDGGRYEKGLISAEKKVDPGEWFFDAHFYQDPVCPGSLGVESFIQMLRYYLLDRYEIDPEKYEPLLTAGEHEWVYRGQIIPGNKKIQVFAHIKSEERAKEQFHVSADGILVVDGITIYEMKDYGLSFVPDKSLKEGSDPAEVPGKDRKIPSSD